MLNIEGPDAEAFTPEARTALQRAGRPPGGGDRERDPLSRDALVRRPPRPRSTRSARRPRRSSTSTSCCSAWPRSCKRVIDYEMFGILLLDEERGELVLRKAVSYGGDQGEEDADQAGRGPDRRRRRSASSRSWSATCSSDPRYLRPHPGDALGARGAARPQGPRDRRLRPRVARRSTASPSEHVKVLTPLASQVAVAIENARLYEEIVRKDERLQTRAARSRRASSTSLFPESRPRGAGWDASAHFLPAARAGRRPLRLLRASARACSGVARGRRRWARACPPPSTAAFASGSRARAGLRAPRPRRPHDAREPHAAQARGGGPLLHARLRALRLPAAARCVLANSGLPYPLLYRAAEGRAVPIELPGLPLGTFDGRDLRRARVALAPGDVVVFYSDGVTEARRGKRGATAAAARPRSSRRRRPAQRGRDRERDPRPTSSVPWSPEPARRPHAGRRQGPVNTPLVGNTTGVR